MRSDARTVDEYIEGLEGDRREAIISLREVLNASIPGLDESMRYGMPTYSRGNQVYAFASQKQYVSLYVRDTDVMHNHADRLGKVSLGKNCVRFTKLDDLDLDATAEMLREMASTD